MTNNEKEICEMVLSEGEIITKVDTLSREGIHVQSWAVKYHGEKYTLTKNDGEWVYFHHN